MLCSGRPGMSMTARRLGRRVWPGPVIMVIAGLANQSSPARLATGEDVVRLRVPAHEAPLEVLELLGGPLVVVPLKGSNNSVRELALGLGDKVTVVIEDGPPTGRLLPTVVHVRGSEWTITEMGAITTEMLAALMPTTVLFVCTGNTCRSPLAEVFCKKLLAERVGCRPEELPERGFLVLSAGLGAMMGLEASPEAVVVAGDYGADLSGHRSQPLTAELLARADYLFTMTQGHLRALLPFCLECGPEPRLLATTGQDVPDPIGAQPEVYRECAQLIYHYLQDCLPDIQPL